MEVIKTERHRNPSKEELRMFLAACQDAAEEDGHFKIASISLQTRRLDPLAVLESIYERDEYHFYLERPDEDWALAGAEAVVVQHGSGPGRMAAAKAWSEEILAHTVAVGDLEAPASGPHFYLGFTFEEELPATAAFAPGTFFLPRWQVARQGDRTTAVANFRIDPTGDLEALTAKLWGAYEKFSTFAYDDAPIPPAAQVVARAEIGGAGTYPDRVRQALDRIAAGEAEKIVVARAVEFTFDRPFRPLVTLAGLRERFSSCYAFSFENDRGQSFIGASPERLLRVAEGALVTEALAGSIARGQTAREDAQRGAELLASAKDRREHAHVVDSICRRLAAMGLNATTEPPGLRVLPNVQHLQTTIQAPLPAGTHLLDLVAALHPTPAVGGVPRAAARAAIAALEPFDRGLYAGAVGYFDHRGAGEFFVGLRAGIIDGNSVRLFAGAGIVEGSDPAAELAETEMKFAALRGPLEGR